LGHRLISGSDAGLELLKKDLMISKITSREACLAELTSNPKSFFNCPDLHGGSGSPGDRCPRTEVSRLDLITASQGGQKSEGSKTEMPILLRTRLRRDKKAETLIR